MRSLPLIFVVFAATAAAQNQQPMDKATQDRLRTEGAAGGTRPSTQEEREGADAGAGPHREFRPGGVSRREHREESAKREESRGASAGKGLQSGDARPGAPRP